MAAKEELRLEQEEMKRLKQVEQKGAAGKAALPAVPFLLTPADVAELLCLLKDMNINEMRVEQEMAGMKYEYKCLGRKARHTCGVIGTLQYRRMESSSASAPPAKEPETIKAVRRVAEWETNAPDPLKTPEGSGKPTHPAPERCL